VWKGKEQIMDAIKHVDIVISMELYTLNKLLSVTQGFEWVWVPLAFSLDRDVRLVPYGDGC